MRLLKKSIINSLLIVLLFSSLSDLSVSTSVIASTSPSNVLSTPPPPPTLQELNETYRHWTNPSPVSDIFLSPNGNYCLISTKESLLMTNTNNFSDITSFPSFSSSLSFLTINSSFSFVFSIGSFFILNWSSEFPLFTNTSWAPLTALPNAVTYDSENDTLYVALNNHGIEAIINATSSPVRGFWHWENFGLSSYYTGLEWMSSVQQLAVMNELALVKLDPLLNQTSLFSPPALLNMPFFEMDYNKGSEELIIVNIDLMVGYKPLSEEWRNISLSTVADRVSFYNFYFSTENMFIASDIGLWEFNPAWEVINYWNSLNGSFPSFPIYSAVFSADFTYGYFEHNTDGLTFFNLTSSTYDRVVYNEGATFGAITSMKWDDSGSSLYFFTSTSLWCYNYLKDTFLNYDFALLSTEKFITFELAYGFNIGFVVTSFHTYQFNLSSLELMSYASINQTNLSVRFTSAAWVESLELLFIGTTGIGLLVYRGNDNITLFPTYPGFIGERINHLLYDHVADRLIAISIYSIYIVEFRFYSKRVFSLYNLHPSQIEHLQVIRHSELFIIGLRSNEVILSSPVSYSDYITFSMNSVFPEGESYQSLAFDPYVRNLFIATSLKGLIIANLFSDNIYNRTTENGLLSNLVTDVFYAPKYDKLFIASSKGLTIAGLDIPFPDHGPPTINSPSDIEIYEGDADTILEWEAYDETPDVYEILRNGSLVYERLWLTEKITYNELSLKAGVYNFTCKVTDKFSSSVSDTIWVTILGINRNSSQSWFQVFTSSSIFIPIMIGIGGVVGILTYIYTRKKLDKN
ncbi:MAG: hypothetical protein ACTSYA_11210 [Candidatus Kariarchaeaceae archaeon]